MMNFVCWLLSKALGGGGWSCSNGLALSIPILTYIHALDRVSRTSGPSDPGVFESLLKRLAQSQFCNEIGNVLSPETS